MQTIKISADFTPKPHHTHPQLKQDYEILSFAHPGYPIYAKKSNGMFSCEGSSTEYNESYLLGCGNRVHSVKRVSDGLIFTLRELVQIGVFSLIINEFRIIKGKSMSFLSVYTKGKPSDGFVISQLNKVDNHGIPIFSYVDIKEFIESRNWAQSSKNIIFNQFCDFFKEKFKKNV